MSSLRDGRSIDVQDSLKLAKARGLGYIKKEKGFTVLVGHYKDLGTYKFPNEGGGERVIHFNARGILFDDDDPNLGYSEQECLPRKNGAVNVGEKTKDMESEKVLNIRQEGDSSSSGNRSWVSTSSASQKADIKLRYFPNSREEVNLPPK